MKRRTFLTGLGISILAAPLASSNVARAAKSMIFTGLVAGTAVGGYDPVAYFTRGRPTPGKPQHSLTHDGAKWLFSSAENLAKFKANPAKYAPQYGGYCAYAVANGYTAKGEPEAWSVVGGKLYLNYSQSIRLRWKAKQAAFITEANKNWPGVLN